MTVAAHLAPAGRATAGVLLRAAPWTPVLALSGSAAVLLGLAAVWADGPLGRWLLLLAMAACSAAAGYSLDEEAAPAVDASPLGRGVRFRWRATVLALPVVTGLTGLGVLGAVEPRLAAARVAPAVVGFAALGVAVAALLHRSGIAAPGDLASVVGAAVTVLVAAAEPLHQWVLLVPLGDGPGYGRTMFTWTAVLVGCALAVALAARDPGARRWSRRARGGGSR